MTDARRPIACLLALSLVLNVVFGGSGRPVCCCAEASERASVAMPCDPPAATCCDSPAPVAARDADRGDDDRDCDRDCRLACCSLAKAPIAPLTAAGPPADPQVFVTTVTDRTAAAADDHAARLKRPPRPTAVL